MRVQRDVQSLWTIPKLILVCVVSLPAQAKYSGGSGDDGTGLRPAAEYALAASTEPARGTLLFEYYWGVDGTLGFLLGLPTYPNYPDHREWRASFEGPTDWKDHYGTCARGYLYPPATGNYTFWIASDDQSQLWLSTDENPAHIVQIASVPIWTPARDFDNTGGGWGGPQQKSTPIRLTAGTKYYIEALQAEGIGGDNLAVAWQGPGIPQRVVIAGQYLAPVMGPADVIDPNLIGWWKLQEGSGDTANDSSGHHKQGTIYHSGGGLGPNGAVWVSDPERGTVLSFNGDDVVGAYVDAGTIPAMDLGDGFTWAFWAKQDVAQPTAVPGGGTDVILGNRYGGTQSPLQFVKFTPTKFEYFNNYDLTAVDYVDLPGGQWIHHAAVKEGATLTYYRDGVQAGTTTLTKTMDPNPFFMGGDAGGERWRGWLSDVRIYDRRLSAAEIWALIHGVRGEYFANMTLSGSPARIPIDPQIYFNWGGEVFPGTWDNCSVRWTGQVEPAFTEPYTFYVNTDDGARLWLNGNLIIDAWWDQGATEHASGPIQLVAGQKCPLRLEWYDNTGSGTCELRWSSPSTPKQVIPSARLHPPEPSTSGGTTSGTPSLTLYPASGPVGTTMNVWGSGFAGNTSGNVISGWNSTYLTTNADGTFLMTLTVPSGLQVDHSYPVQADIPSGGSVEASASFTVTTSGSTPSIAVSPTSGPTGTPTTITGSGFAASTSGNVTLGGSSKSVTTSPTGTFSTTLTVPSVSAGSYPVQADIPSGGSVEASASFTVTTSSSTPSIAVSPTSGPTGTPITITGSGFAASTSGNVTLGGSSKSVTTSPTGTFSTTMTVPVPSVSAGSYAVQADIPSGGSVEASASFTLTTSGPTPSLVLVHTTGPAGTEIGIAGKDFAGNTSGTVTLAGVSVPVTTAPAGWFTTSLTVPSVSPGTYLVQADIPSGGSVEASASFTITTGPAPEIDLTLVGGPGGSTVIAIAGVHFATNTSGRAFVDLNGDGHYDFLEPSESLTTAADGSFSTSLTVSAKTQEGLYYVMVDCPIGSPIEASAAFMVNQ